jgi:hypothetical protein
MTLSSLIDAYYCSKGEPECAAEWALIGMLMAESRFGLADVGRMRELIGVKNSLLRAKDYKPVVHREAVVVFGHAYDAKDAFLGHLWTDDDGLQRVTFPGHGIHVSSASLVEDWRYLILAVASGVDTSAPAVLEVVYADKTVRGFVSAETWEALDEIHTALRDSTRAETPGALCVRCTKRGECASYARFQDRNDLPPDNLKDKRQSAHRLWMVAVALKAKLKSVEASWKLVSRRLKDCVEEGRVNINDYFYLDAQSQERSSYPFGPTHALLQRHGRWSPNYGKIQVGELGKDLQTFPKELQQALEALKQTDTSEPSMREVVHNGEHSVKASDFIGVLGKKQRNF